MKYFLFIFSAVFITPPSLSKLLPSKTDGTEVLKKVMERLKGLKTVSYRYKSISDYPADGYHDETTIYSYLDFDADAQLTGFKYQFNNNSRLLVYNGSEAFYCDKKGKTIEINNAPDIRLFNSSPFLVNSLVTLKIACPE